MASYDQVRAVALALKTRCVELYNGVVPVFDAVSSWTLDSSNDALPTEGQVKEQVEAYEQVRKNPIRLNTDVVEIKEATAESTAIASGLYSWDALFDKPDTFPPSPHTHDGIGKATWSNVTGKPSAFPPSAHTHEESDISDLSIDWADLTGKPSTFPPEAHTHPANVPDYILLRDVKPSGTHGGNAVVGTNVRDITEITLDAGGHASLSSNQVTLAAGTYYHKAQTVGRYVGNQRLSLYNVTDQAVVPSVSGIQSSAPDGHQKAVSMQKQFTLSSPKTFEIQHICQNARTQYGLGGALSLGDEVFLIAEFWKIS